MKKSIVLTLLALAISWQKAKASSEELHTYLRDVSFRIGNFLRDKKEDKIVLNFTGPATFRNSSAEGFIQLLADKLKDQNIKVVDQASFAFQGQFQVATGTSARLKAEALSEQNGNKATTALADYERRFLNDEKNPDPNKRLALKLTGKMTDVLGEPVGPSFPIFLSEKLLAPTLGLSVSLSGGLQGAGRTNAIQNAIKSPNISVNDGVVRASSASPYTMEIYVKKERRKIDVRDGLGYVPLALGEEYLVQFGNNSNQDIVVELKIDGLSAFHLCEKRKGDRKSDPPAYRYFAIAAGKKASAQGWYINEKNSLAFLVTPLQESVAFQTGKTSQIGMITATIYASWQAGQRPPLDEPKTNLMEYDSAEGLPSNGLAPSQTLGGMMPGTGTGQNINTNLKAITGRQTGVERATLTLRYERPKN